MVLKIRWKRTGIIEAFKLNEDPVNERTKFCGYQVSLLDLVIAG